MKLRVSRRKIRTEINEVEARKTIEDVNKTKLVFEKIRLTLSLTTKKRKLKYNQKGKRNTTTHTTDTKDHKRLSQLSGNKVYNLEEMNKFLDTYNL